MATQRRGQDEGDGVLVTECEAFLDGTLAEYWDERGADVPVWAWTNLLAHGSEALIGESVARPTRPRRAARSWRIARSYLAHQVLEVTRPAPPAARIADIGAHPLGARDGGPARGQALDTPPMGRHGG